MKQYAITLDIESENETDEAQIAELVSKALLGLPLEPYIEFSNVDATLESEDEEEN